MSRDRESRNRGVYHTELNCLIAHTPTVSRTTLGVRLSCPTGGVVRRHQGTSWAWPFYRGAQRLEIPFAPMGSPFTCRVGELPLAQSTAVLVMDLEALKLELLRCLERAEEADRDDVRRQ